MQTPHVTGSPIIVAEEMLSIPFQVLFGIVCITDKERLTHWHCMAPETLVIFVAGNGSSPSRNQALLPEPMMT